MATLLNIIAGDPKNFKRESFKNSGKPNSLTQGEKFIKYQKKIKKNTVEGFTPSLSKQTKFVLERINEIPFVTVAHVTTGKFNIFCKIRAKDTKHAKDVIFMIDDIEGVYRTETMISLEESINDKKRLMHTIFKDI